MLRSMRYGEADRILHVFTPRRGQAERHRQGRAAHAQPLRRPSRALRPRRPAAPRGPQRPPDGHRRRHARGARAPARRRRPLDAAGRACDAVARLFETGDPHPDVFHLLCHELALLDASAGAVARRSRGPAGQPARVPPEAPARRGPGAAAGDVRVLRRARAPHRLLRRGRRRGVRGLRGRRVRARRGRPRLHGAGARAPARAGAAGRRACAAPGRARDRRDGRAPRGRPSARRGGAGRIALA